MPKNNPGLTNSKASIAVSKLPEKREFFMGRTAQLPSRWPFRVEGACAAPRLSSAEGRSVGHQERSSFIT